MCHWSAKVSGLDANGNEVTDIHLFFTIDDEPLVHEDIFFSAPASWSGNTEYDLNDVVSHDSMYWQSLSDENTVLPQTITLIGEELEFMIHIVRLIRTL